MGALKLLLGTLVVAIGCALAFFGSDWADNSPDPLVLPPRVASPAAAPATPRTVAIGDPSLSLYPPEIGGGEAVGALAFAPTHIVEAAGLNLRSAPNSSSPIVESFPRGTEVQVIEQSANWVRVTTRDQVEGWMFGRYLAEVH